MGRKQVWDMEGNLIVDEVVSDMMASYPELTINAIYPPIPLIAAKFDGATDDSQALQNMINGLQGKGGGKLVLPPGTAKCNVVVSDSRINLEGAGGATVLKPYDLTLPVLSVGNTAKAIYKITLRDFMLWGDNQASISDGLVIDGVSFLTVDNLMISSFGRDNIRITSTGAQPSQFLNFNNTNSKNAWGSCLNVDYGMKWVTSVHFNNFLIEGRDTAGATAINLSGIVHLDMVNTWVQIAGDKKGHIVFNDDYNFIRGNMTVDGGGTGLVGVEIKGAKSAPTRYFIGNIIINARIAYKDGTYIEPSKYQGGLVYHSMLSYPIVANSLIFGDRNSSIEAVVNSSEANTMTVYNIAKTLYVSIDGVAEGCIFAGKQGTPVSKSADGIKGQMMWDDVYIYLCIAQNTWTRIPRDTTW